MFISLGNTELFPVKLGAKPLVTCLSCHDGLTTDAFLREGNNINKLTSELQSYVLEYFVNVTVVNKVYMIKILMSGIASFGVPIF